MFQLILFIGGTVLGGLASIGIGDLIPEFPDTDTITEGTNFALLMGLIVALAAFVYWRTR